MRREDVEMKTEIKGTTKLMALIGTPIGHSGSPAMYNYCFEKDQLDYAYVAFDIDIPQVEQFIQSAKVLGFKGFNITMPCKQEVVKYMDELSLAARLIGACNMVTIEGDKMTGYNTDGVGFVENLRAYGVDVKGKKIVIVGAGGAGIAIQVQCAIDGASEISVFNPKDEFFENAVKKAEEIQKEIPACHMNVYDLADEALFKNEVAQSAILINATKAGMSPMQDTTIVNDVSVFREDLVVADVVYNPKETKLMREAKEAGCKTVIGGVGMLVRQGAVNYHLYTGKEMPVEEVEEKFFS